jgi:hypothetical protein
MHIPPRFRPTQPVLESGVYAAITNTGASLGQYDLPAGACFPLQKVAAGEIVWYSPIGMYQPISH